MPGKPLLQILLFLLLLSSAQGDCTCGVNKYWDKSLCPECCTANSYSKYSCDKYTACFNSYSCYDGADLEGCYSGSITRCKTDVKSYCCRTCATGTYSKSTSGQAKCYSCTSDQIKDGTCSGYSSSITSSPSETSSASSNSYNLKHSHAWFMDSGLSSVAFIVTFSLHIFIVALTIILQLFTVDQRETRFLGRYALPLLWFFFDICYMSARFNWYMTSEDAEMIAYKIEDDGVVDGYPNYIWRSPDFEYLNKSQLDLSACKLDAKVTRQKESFCTFMIFKFTPTIIGQSNSYQSNSSKFSIGLGIIIWSFISFYVMMKNASMSDANDQDDDMSRIADVQSRASRNTRRRSRPRNVELESGIVYVNDTTEYTDANVGGATDVDAGDIRVECDGGDAENAGESMAVSTPVHPKDEDEDEDTAAEESDEESEKEGKATCSCCDSWKHRTWKERFSSITTRCVLRRVGWLLLSTALASQQSLVLLPLTSMEITPYCYTLQDDIPVTSGQAACWHFWSIAGIPYGIPSIIGGFLVMLIFSSEDSDKSNCCVLLFQFTGFVFFVTGLFLFCFWLIGGVFIGMWFTFVSGKILFDLALTKIFAPILIIISTDVVIREARVSTVYTWFRVPQQVMATKLRISRLKERIDARLSAMFKGVTKRYLPCIGWCKSCFGSSGSDSCCDDFEQGHVRTISDQFTPGERDEATTGSKRRSKRRSKPRNEVRSMTGDTESGSWSQSQRRSKSKRRNRSKPADDSKPEDDSNQEDESNNQAASINQVKARNEKKSKDHSSGFEPDESERGE
eukprot:768751-Hanusia_phi.AAC.3